MSRAQFAISSSGQAVGDAPWGHFWTRAVPVPARWGGPVAGRLLPDTRRVLHHGDHQPAANPVTALSPGNDASSS
jgi:hypothetical protein